MDFTFSAEQSELATTVGALLTKRADSQAVRRAMESDAGYDEDLWRTLCEQIGAAALAIPEEYGGAGFSLFESLIVLEQLGRSLAPSPLLASVVTAEALLTSGDEEACARLLPRIAAGEVATIALDPALVPHGEDATVLLAVVDGTLVEVDPRTITRTRREAMDQTLRLAALDLTAARTTVITGDATAAVERAERVGAAAVTALQVGLAAHALDLTVEYSKQRQQFGRPIGSFQVLKHRMADLYVLLEMSRSAAWTAWSAVANDTPDATERTHVAKAYCSDALQQIAAETVQLHGGIAITWEHDAHLVFKRAHSLGQLFGTSLQHRSSLAL